MDMSMPDINVGGASKPVTLTIPVTRCTPPMVERLKEILARHPGEPRCTSSCSTAPAATLLRLGRTRVAPTTALMADLKALLGPGALAS